jgi:hypothetical protein
MTIVEALIAESSKSSNDSAFAVVGDHDVPEDGKDSIWRRHLHDEVSVMWYSHELGEHRLSEDGVVGRAEVRDFEGQVLRSEVLRAEGDRQAYATYGVCSLAGHDPVEGFITRSHFGEVELC